MEGLKAHLQALLGEDEYRVARNHVDRGLGVTVVVIARGGQWPDVGLAQPDL